MTVILTNESLTLGMRRRHLAHNPPSLRSVNVGIGTVALLLLMAGLIHLVLLWIARLQEEWWGEWSSFHPFVVVVCWWVSFAWKEVFGICGEYGGMEWDGLGWFADCAKKSSTYTVESLCLDWVQSPWKWRTDTPYVDVLVHLRANFDRSSFSIPSIDKQQR